MKNKTIFLFVFSLISIIQLNVFSQIDTPPTIDGNKETIWETANFFKPLKLVKNTPGDDGPSEEDLSAVFYTLWDADNFYLFIEVKDDKIITSNNDKDHQNDNIEVYFDLNNSKLSLYDGHDDDQLRFIHGWDTVNTKRNVLSSDLSFQSVQTDNGYNYEISIPWSSLTAGTFTAGEDSVFGFDLMVTDNDGTTSKDYILAWNSETNDAYQNTSIFGTMKLLGSGTTEKVISDDAPAEHDEYAIDESKIEVNLFVAVDDPAADDNNEGTEQVLPLKTIKKALEKASVYLGQGKPTKISIANGVYREYGLSPIKSGNAYKFMNSELVIEGEEPGGVIITGAEQWNSDWTIHTAGVYKHAWPYEMVPKKAWGDSGPNDDIAFRREMVYVDGYWMEQVKSLNALKANSFYVDEANDLLYVQVADSIDFEASDKEISLYGDGIDAPWPPSRLMRIPSEKDKVVLRNLVFRHANMRINEGAVRIYGWKVLMENCTVHWNNGVGLNISEDVELVTLRNCNFDNNGGSGIITWGSRRLVFEESSTSFNNWRGNLANFHSFAIGGIKFHHTRDIEVINHQAIGNWCPGLWTDLEIFDITYTNCTVEDNYGDGFLIEISKDVYLKKCTVKRNIPGIHCHSSHDVYIDSCHIEGNAVQFTVYKDHRNFSSSNWTEQFDGRVWDKTPYNWNITNTTVISVDDSEWQAYADNIMPSWMYYTNPGYQAFWHFSHPEYMSVFFGAANIAYENNKWIHPTTDTPFKDDKNNDLTFEEWEIWISGLAAGNKAIEVIDGYAKNNNAENLTIDLLNNAGGENVNEDYLEEYKIIVEDADGVPELSTLQDIIDAANAFAAIRDFADANDASGLNTQMLLDCGVTFRTDRMTWYMNEIQNVTSDDLPDIAALQDLLDNAQPSDIKSNIHFELTFYPNPARSNITFSGNQPLNKVVILDIAGKKVLETTPENKRVIDVSELQPGIYTVMVEYDKRKNVMRLIKQ